MRNLIVALLLAPLGVIASDLPQFPFVYVSGKAAREVPPDTASIRFRLKTYHADVEKALLLQSSAADALLSYAAKLALKAETITAEPVEKSLVRKRTERDESAEILGYNTARTVRIELRELKRFTELMEFLYRQPHLEDLSVTFGSTEEAGILRDLTIAACSDAKTKAEYLSAGFQRKLGNVRAVSESGVSSLGGIVLREADQSAEARYRGLTMVRDFRVIPSTIAFHKQVFAVFALE